MTIGRLTIIFGLTNAFIHHLKTGLNPDHILISQAHQHQTNTPPFRKLKGMTTSELNRRWQLFVETVQPKLVTYPDHLYPNDIAKVLHYWGHDCHFTTPFNPVSWNKTDLINDDRLNNTFNWLLTSPLAVRSLPQAQKAS